MDFAMLPPEINSARMYAGAGSGPMLAAASAWEALAAELQATASAYQSAITGLTAGPWLGPSSMMMAAAAAPYVTWMQTTAAQAEQTAIQAVEAAAAYEAAFAATVPPPVVAANRSLLAALVASNFFGQNTSAIAATETQYSEMWAQDAGAMQSYAGTSAAATRLRSFNAPSSNTDTGAETEQGAAVSQASDIGGGTAQQAFTRVPELLTTYQAPLAAADPLSALDTLNLLADLSGLFVDPEIGLIGIGVDAPLGITALPFDVGGFYTGLHTDDIVSGWAGVQGWPGVGTAPPSPFPVITGAQTSAVSAGLADATSVGRMSVPATWAAAAPEFRLSAMALPATTIGAAAEASAGGAGSLFSQMALASMAGRAMAGTTGAGGPGMRERVGVAAGKPAKPGDKDEAEEALPGGPITGISAELRELFALRDAGILTAEEFAEQKQRLLPH